MLHTDYNNFLKLSYKTEQHPTFFLQIVATGVCHTDFEYLFQNEKGMRFRPFPLVLGHEAAGVVESVGAGVTKFSPGK